MIVTTKHACAAAGRLALIALSAALAAAAGCAPSRDSERAAPDTTAAESRAEDLAGRLAPSERDSIDRGPLRSWVDAQIAAIPNFSLGALTLESTSKIHEQYQATTLDEQFGGNEARRSLLVRSPDGRWVLDTYYGMEIVERSGRPAAAWDADRGFRVFDARTDSLRVYEVLGTTAVPWMGAWIGPDRFVVVGDAILTEMSGQPPPDPAPRTPIAWLGDMESRELTTFRGPAIPDSLWDRYARARLDAFAARQPQIQWE